MTGPTPIEDVLSRLPPGWTPAPPPGPVHRHYAIELGAGAAAVPDTSRLVIDGVDLVPGAHQEPVLEAFESDLQRYVAEHARGRVFVHAGAVGWHGQGIVLPGSSWSGKTTLVAELVRSGATYYSDEYAVLDRLGRVHPYPRPLALRGSDGRRSRCSAEALGGRTGDVPLRVGLVVVTEFRSGERWEPRRLSPGTGVLALLAHTVAARRRPRPSLAVLARVAADGVVVAGVRNDARAVVDAILSLSSRQLLVTTG
jgi:hypothetical protein